MSRRSSVPSRAQTRFIARDPNYLLGFSTVHEPTTT